MKPDQRRHKRFPVLKDMAEPVDLIVMEATPREVPAVLTNLSAGGMALVVFAHVSGDTKLKIVMDVGGLKDVEFQGHVAWTEPKGDTTAVGVRFNHLSQDAVARVNHLAEDYQDCELKISFGLKDVCFRQCAYWSLCAKPLKIKD